MALSLELLRRLDQEEEPLPKRLRLALAAFGSNDLLVQRKEELILNWLCKYGENHQNTVEIWNVLKACLSSNNINQLSGANIRPTVKSSITQILCELLKAGSVSENSKCVSLILECAICILENINFQQYFRRQSEEFFELVNAILNVGLDGYNSAFYIKTLQSVSLLNKQVFQKEQFSVLFIQKVLLTIIGVLADKSADHINNASTNRIRAETFKCVQQVLFPKSRSKEISQTFQSLFAGNSDNQSTVLESLLELLSSSFVSLVSESVVNLYSVIFKAFISSYKSDLISVYRMFVTLCYFIGLKPQVKLKSDGELKCLLKHKLFKKTFPQCHIRKDVEIDETSLKVTKTLINNLSDANVQLDETRDELPFEDWLRSLLSLIYSSISTDSVSTVLLEVTSAFIHLSPLIIEPKMSEILECVMLVKKETPELRLAYIAFLHNVLEMFVKLSRIQKLIAKLLTLGKVLDTKKDEELPLLSDILPTEFCAEFQSIVTLLPGWQVIGLMRSLLFHLNQDCVTVLEKQRGNSPQLFLQVVSMLLCHFLRGTRVAEHSVPAQVVSKFNDTLTDLQELLGKLGQALLHREHNCPLMIAFLQLCYNFGEIRILLLHYGVKTETSTVLQLAALQKDFSPTNLTYLHPYLSSELWDLVAQRIGNFGEADCRELLVKLVLQKLHAVVLLVEEVKMRQDVASAAAKYLISHIRESWSLLLSGRNALLVAPFLNSEQLDCLANHIVQEIVCSAETKSDWCDALTKPAIQENRTLVLALTCATLSGITKLFCRTKRKHSSPNHKVGPPTSLAREVLVKIIPSSILQCFSDNDLNAVEVLIAEMAAIVNEGLRKEKISSVTNGYKLDITTFCRYLNILKVLPLSYAPKALKSLVIMGVLALVVTLEGFDMQKEEIHNLKIVLYKDLLLGLLDSPDPPDISSHIDMGQLAHWLTTVELSLPRNLRSLLFQQLFESSLKHSSSLQQLQDGLPLLQKQDDAWQQGIQALETAVTLLQVLNKCQKQHQNPEDHSFCKKYQRRLSRGIVKVMKQLSDAGISPAVSEGFNLVLLRYLKKGNTKLLAKLTPHLDTVIERALSHLQNKDLSTQSSSVQSSVDIMSTLLQHRSQLSDSLPSNFTHKVWSVLSSKESLLAFSDNHMKLLFEAATEKEFHVILKDLSASTKNAIKSSENPQLLKTRLIMWKAVVSGKIKGGKVNTRKVALEHLCQMLTVFVSQWSTRHTTSPETVTLPILDLMLTIAHNTMLYLSPEMLDLCFESVVAALAEDSPEILTLCFMSMRVLQTLIKCRDSLILDRIPSFLQCYRQLATVVSSHGHVGLDYKPPEVQKCADCAQRLERLTNSLKEHKAHFVRLAPYLVADLLHQFETYALYPQVKLHFTNCVNSLLSLCDSHALSFLSRTLTPASQQLFKTFYANYKKFHRFTGKV